ncbi:Tetratricopeptide repeat domain 27 [Branchiostoma belcheri]|nr:Tetratricopeptide repeat domain 27 [Branchiostoma belcheri]
MAVPADDSHVLRTSLELNILAGTSCPTDCGENADVSSLCGHLSRGDYGQVLKTAAARTILGTERVVMATEPYPEFLRRQVQEYLSNAEGGEHGDTPVDRELCVLQTGVACLQLFVQSNWTGPPVDGDQTDILPQAYRQDQKDLLEPVCQSLTCDGESAYPLCSNLLYFLAARTLLMDSYHLMTHCQTAGWWGLRCVWVHQQLMEESRLPSLQQLALKYIQDVTEREEVLFSDSCRWLQVLYQLESGYTCLHYYQYTAAQEHFSSAAKLARLQVELTAAQEHFSSAAKLARLQVELTAVQEHFSSAAKLARLQVELTAAQEQFSSAAKLARLQVELTAAQEHFSSAAKLARLQVELTVDQPPAVVIALCGPRATETEMGAAICDHGHADGAMGKRTRFQQGEKAQLVLQVHREGGCQLEQPDKGVALTPKDVALDDDTLLNQMKLTDPDQLEVIDISSVEQALVLGLCINRKRNCPKDKLTEEEYLLDQPRDWSVQTAALLLRCRGEKTSSRKVERSMMQLQSLVDQYKSLTPPAQVRLGLVYSVALPPRWIMERELAQLLVSLGALSKVAINRNPPPQRELAQLLRELAQLLVSLGALSSALDILLRLHMYQKAEQLIQDQLAVQETPTLYCLLGDVRGEKQHYEKAWELSNHRSARAQRSLGWANFKEEKFSEAISCFEKSVEINGLQNAVWFALGCAGMSAQRYDVSARGFSRCVLIDYDNFEAWNNLATSYIRLNQKQKAFRALKESLRCNFEHWKIWENYLLVCTDLGEFEELVTGYHRMLDLKDKHADVQVLQVLVDAVSQDLQDNSGRPASRLRGKAVELFGRLTSKVTNNAQIWRLYARLHGDGQSEDAQENEKALQCLQKAHRCSTQSSGWDREPASAGHVMDQALLLAQAAMTVSKRKTNSTEAIQSLSAAKMVLRQVGTKVRQVHTDAMTGQVPEDLAGRLAEVDQTLATIQGEEVKETESFEYLGSVVDRQGGTDRDVSARMGKARAAFIMLRKVWASRGIRRATKLRIFNSNVKSVLLYGSETWRTTRATQHRLQIFINTCLRRIFKIRWWDRLSNQELWDRAGQNPIGEQILKRKWSWIGHTLRKANSSITLQALTWNPQGKRKRGRPKNSWRRDTEEMRSISTSWQDLKKKAQR